LLTQFDEAKVPWFYKFFKNMKKMLLIVAVAFVAMSCGKKCCDKQCCQDTAACDTVEVVEAAEAVEVAAE
jgi:hypothetical protein